MLEILSPKNGWLVRPGGNEAGFPTVAPCRPYARCILKARKQLLLWVTLSYFELGILWILNTATTASKRACHMCQVHLIYLSREICSPFLPSRLVVHKVTMLAYGTSFLILAWDPTGRANCCSNLACNLARLHSATLPKSFISTSWWCFALTFSSPPYWFSSILIKGDLAVELYTVVRNCFLLDLEYRTIRKMFSHTYFL